MTFTQTQRRGSAAHIVRPTRIRTRVGNFVVLGVRREVTHVAVGWTSTSGHHYWACYVAYGFLTARDALHKGTIVPMEMAQRLFPGFAHSSIYAPSSERLFIDESGQGESEDSI